MRKDVEAAWKPLQAELFSGQKQIENQALVLYKKNPEEARKFLTQYSIKWGEKVVNAAWQLGDELWTKYDEKF